MNTQQFLSEFGHIMSAPNGVNQLRQLIYNLAITGKLMTQIDSDDDIELLLINIKITKEKLISEKVFRGSPKLEELPLLLPEDVSLPNSWRWSRLVDIGDINPRNSGVADDCLASFIPMSHLPEIHSEKLRFEEQLWGKLKKGYTHFADGDIVIAKITPCFENGKAAVISELINGIGAGTTELHVIRPLPNLIEPNYVYIFLRSPYFITDGRNKMTGTAGQKRLPMSYFATRAFPLPPIAEQRRIVAKVDELMALCDRLEYQQQERNALCQITRTAFLNAFVNEKNALQSKVVWARINDNINLLLDSEQGFSDLRYSLTKLAVKGFVSNWTKESPLLHEIKKECSSLKQDYVHKGWLRTRKLVAPKLHENDAYPSHWGILPLDEVAVIIGGITKGHKLKGEDVRSHLYLSVANVQRGFFDLTAMKHIEVPMHQIEKYRVEIGDLLIAEGGDWDKVGRTAIWAGELPDCLHQNHIFKARIPSSLLLNEWVELVLNSEIGRDYFAGASKQTTNLASINMTQLRSFPLPIPPVSEQVAILQKVNYLLSICQKLKQQRLDLQNVAQMLASAAISSITGIQFEDKEKMKVPKTELVSNLRIGISPANSERAPLAAILIRNNGEIPAKTLWQASGLEIDSFYQQLKTEMTRGWIVQPAVAYMREVEAT
jgi:type I restriction enzyme, S subunit